MKTNNYSFDKKLAYQSSIVSEKYAMPTVILFGSPPVCIYDNVINVTIEGPTRKSDTVDDRLQCPMGDENDLFMKENTHINFITLNVLETATKNNWMSQFHFGFQYVKELAQKKPNTKYIIVTTAVFNPHDTINALIMKELKELEKLDNIVFLCSSGANSEVYSSDKKLSRKDWKFPVNLFSTIKLNVGFLDGIEINKKSSRGEGDFEKEFYYEKGDTSGQATRNAALRLCTYIALHPTVPSKKIIQNLQQSTPTNALEN